MNKSIVDRQIQASQKNEITEHFIYENLATTTRNERIRDILHRISQDELKHYNLFKNHTGQAEKPNKTKVWFYCFIGRVFGLTFGLKLMERGEGRAQIVYNDISAVFAEAKHIAHEEDEHEEQLIEMIQEERLGYMGSTIRGLNDALVELTGALAGFTLAFQNPNLIAMSGLITGIAGALSMSVTEYLAKKTEESQQVPLKSSLYTGVTYVITVFCLIAPYLILDNVYVSLGIMVVTAVIIISLFNFYQSVAKGGSFWKRFSEMALLSLGVAAISFFIGLAVRQVIGVDV